MNETNRLEIFREKIQPTKDLLAKMKKALDTRPEILADGKRQELLKARDYARGRAYGHPAAPGAEEALKRLTEELRRLDQTGPFLPEEAAIYAAELANCIQDAERWAYVIMLYNLLDTFTTLTYWQDLQLYAINTGYAYFNRAQYWPEHWKLSRHADTELKIMALVDEITEIVMEEGQELNNEINS